MIDPDMNAQKGGNSHVQVTGQRPEKRAHARLHGVLGSLRSAVRRPSGGRRRDGDAHRDEGGGNRDVGWNGRRRNRARHSGGTRFLARRHHHHPEGGRAHQTVHLGPFQRGRRRVAKALLCALLVVLGIAIGEAKDRSKVQVHTVLAVLPPGCHDARCSLLKPLVETRTVYIKAKR